MTAQHTPDDAFAVRQERNHLYVENERLRSINAELLAALRLATQYVEKTHGVVAGAVGNDNLVLPDLERCRAAIAKATGGC